MKINTHRHLINLSTQTLLPRASGASKGLRILQDFWKVVCSCSTPFYNGGLQNQLLRSQRATRRTHTYYTVDYSDSWNHTIELTTLIHKIIVSIASSAHELRYDQIKVYQGVGTALLKSGILSGPASDRQTIPQPFGAGIIVVAAFTVSCQQLNFECFDKFRYRICVEFIFLGNMRVLSVK